MREDPSAQLDVFTGSSTYKPDRKPPFARHLAGAKTVNEFISFELSYNLFYFLCVIIRPVERVVTRRYEGWLRTGLYF